MAAAAMQLSVGIRATIRNVGSHPDSGIAFVLGGGGILGSAEVGMLRALLEHGIHPDLIVGTSVGAINGAVIADRADADHVGDLERFWRSLSEHAVFSGSTLRRVGTLARTRTHAHEVEPLAELLTKEFGTRLIERLAVRFQCVAASIERSAEHWFDHGPVVDAVLASAAVPGLFPPHAYLGEHFFDGGLVHSVPVGRAVALGAQTVYVCHVGRIERPLKPPTKPWEVAMVAFEVARRHRFHADMAAVPPSVTVHVLPTGDQPPAYADLSALRYRDTSRVTERIKLAREATAAYLDRLGL
jgi:NTE family protein